MHCGRFKSSAVDLDLKARRQANAAIISNYAQGHYLACLSYFPQLASNLIATLTPLINIENASVMRDQHLALNGFNLRIEQGESLAILGPNGAGKSTLLKLINRELYPLVKPETKVEILGQEHFDLSHFRTHIGLISQDLQNVYDDNVPGLEVVISGFFSSISLWQHQDIQPEQIQRASEVMANLNIADLRDRLFGELSSGQQRRLLLARALVHAPATLILDEPTTGMDIKASFHYLSTVNSLLSDQNNKQAVVLVTHHLHEIPSQVNRVVLIKDGRSVFDGAKQDALTDTRLSDLFDTELHLLEKNGLYQVYPAER